MLSTLLAIGKVFRDEQVLKHHRYVKRAPQRDTNPKNAKAFGNSTRIFVVPATVDGRFNFAQRIESDNENLREQLFYLNYKTSDAESYKKYIFGDIYKLRVPQGKEVIEDGNFRFGDETKKNLYGVNSFLRAEVDVGTLENKRIKAFRQSFTDQMTQIEAFFYEHPNVFLHFDFGGKHWYELADVMETINAKLMSSFTAEIENSDRDVNGFVLRKTLYKTLTSASEGPSGRVPRFTMENEYKNKLFENLDDVMNLLYVIDFSTKAVIRKGEVKIIVLPRGEGLTAQDIERFFTRQSLESEKPQEEAQRIRDAVERAQNRSSDDMEELFAAPLAGATREMTQFDFIFSKAGSGPSSPDVDLIEVLGLQRGLLEKLSRDVVRIRNEVEKERPKSDKIFPLSIMQSFLNILGDSTKAKKKYHNHLFKVLPQIYTGTYYRDDVLLPALIEKSEFAVRNDDKMDFFWMKFDFEFLTKIQNRQENRMKEITESPSYQIGLYLGKMARPFTNQKSPIKSFKKNYVGLLSRRIITLADAQRLGNEIREKLEMHEAEIIRDQNFFPRRAMHDFFQAASNFPKGTAYNRQDCAFGFFQAISFIPDKKVASDDGSDKNADSIEDEEAITEESVA